MRSIHKLEIIDSCKKINSYLLSFQEYPQATILIAIRNEFKKIYTDISDYFILENINYLFNELNITVSAAIENQITLNTNNISLLNNIIDLIYVSYNIEYDKLYKLNCVISLIFDYYIKQLKNINIKISINPKLSYIKSNENIFLKDNINRISNKDDENLLKNQNLQLDCLIVCCGKKDKYYAIPIAHCEFIYDGEDNEEYSISDCINSVLQLNDNKCYQKIILMSYDKHLLNMKFSEIIACSKLEMLNEINNNNYVLGISQYANTITHVLLDIKSMFLE